MNAQPSTSFADEIGVTHAVAAVMSGPRLSDPELDWLTAQERLLALDEMRAEPEQVWLVMTRRSH